MKPALSLLAVSLTLLVGESAAGVVSAMSVQTNPVYTNSKVRVQLSGQGQCMYGVRVFNPGGSLIWESGVNLRSTNNYFDVELAPLSVQPGAHTVYFMNGYGADGCNAPTPPDVKMQVGPVPPPPPPVAQVNSDMLVITSQGAANPAKQPFPTGKFQYSLPTLKSPGCMVDVRVQGPENVYQNGVNLIPGEMTASGQWSGVKSGNFELRMPGKYSLTMVLSANAPAELRCKGLPIGKNFDVASVFRSTTPGMSQPFNPITPPNPLIKPDAGQVRP